MEKIKENLAVKTAAFLLLQILITLTVVSALVAAVNLSNSWYSQSRQAVEKSICHELAIKSYNRVSDAFEFLTLDWDEEDEARDADAAELEDVFYGEQDAAGFGYLIHLSAAESADGEEHQRSLHSYLAEQPEAYCEVFDHDTGTRVEIYLADLDKSGALPPELEATYRFDHSMYQHRNHALGAGIAGLMGAIALLVFLLAAAGHSREKNASWLQKIPLDLAAAAVIVPFMLLGIALEETIAYDSMAFSFAALEILGISILVTGFILLFAVNVKKSGWWKHTIICHLLIFGKKACIKAGKILSWFFRQIVKQIPLVWRTALFLAAALLVNFIAMMIVYDAWDVAMLLWFLEAIAVSVCVIYTALLLKRLKEGGKHLAEGNLSDQIDKKGMWFDFAEHADHLNSIGQGMSRAVEERMKSERFKAELITNVSHDIKTPLTSIINYVDFLKKEEIENEKAQEYIEVLDRQSRRLKKLTEDLVDASKAATGNVKMHMAPCQIGVLMDQAMGEYKEKAEKNDLRFIMKVPDEDLEIMADSRRLWRVFDNLLGNICKYSQPGTRVYLDLVKQGDKAVITYRNTSKYELNITEEELMERFVRGDSSRHTEGSGLGLSIAQNLVELQGGSFAITIDGDLFKVIMEFDLLQ